KPAPIKKKLKKEKAVTPKGKLPLTELSGLGPTTEQKFVELGVNSVEELLLEDPSELSQLIKGCSEERIKKWIEEGKELINK
ncbi:MAG: helix-hairpin-helix domain-containing protein, partial [Candidatus Thorarchaeota archaeon]